jgi:hypothetical protein
MKDQTVILIRRFIPASPQRGDWEFLSPLAGGAPQRWPALEALYRVLILAEPGAGKTYEVRERARKLSEKGKKAFFIRIEKLNSTFENAFEIGTAEEFEGWLTSTEEGWFFLDSVDEAQLETPRAFEDAIRIFGTRIREAGARAHVYITSREDAWQALPDRSLIEQNLPFAEPLEEADNRLSTNEPTAKASEESALKIFRLAPLKKDEIKLFASYHAVGDVEAFLDAIGHADLMSLAEKPFDLCALIEKWQADRTLENRLEVLQRVVDLQIKPLSLYGSAVRISPDRLRYGVRALAAAATLTGKSVICVPGGIVSPDRMDPVAVLPDWSTEEITALLKTGVFDDVVYGSVRFRHREIRELLTAEWAASIAEQPDGRKRVKDLFFRVSYGEEVIVPRLRPTLAWLILFDEQIRDRAMAINSEIATEGGDPSRLPLNIRCTMLADIVRRIAADDEAAPWMDNAAITRIAADDLSAETEKLLARFRDNDDAIFFLGRFVWQGKIASCIPMLADIAPDRSRNLNARIAATRAVMTVGDEAERDKVVSAITMSQEPLDRQLLSEIILNLPASEASVRIILNAVERTEPKRRFEITGVELALRDFVDRLAIMADSAPEQPLLRLIEGFDTLLGREPYIQRGECFVSQAYSWLIPSVLRAVERLVETRSSSALALSSISVIMKAQAAKFWDHDSDNYEKNKLHELVPRWQELNDALYWQSVEERRAQRQAKGERLTDDWQLTIYDRFWKFTESDFDRCLSWVHSRENPDARLIALSRCFTLYLENGKPAAWVEKLSEAVAGQPELEAQLEQRLHPPAQATPDWEIEHRNIERKRARRERKSAGDRAAWISELKDKPDRIRHPSGAEPGQMTGDHYHLMTSIEGKGWTRYDARSDWRSLIPEFGRDVAEAFRDAAVAHWRHYDPKLRSEGADGSSIPHALVFALIGLEIEAGEDGSFGDGLSTDMATHAFRYITWELNGFPRWFEALYLAHRREGLAAVIKELVWELDIGRSGTALHHILSDIDDRAPWLHADMAPTLWDWLFRGEPASDDILTHSLKILQTAQVPDLAGLAKRRLASNFADAQRPRWYALWVAYEPDEAIPALRTELEGFGNIASEFAQQFVVSLLGTRHGADAISTGYRTASHLKELYILMHRFIRAEDDIERAGTGAYSPTLRDNAQDARNKLFNLLSEMPGEETYQALKQLASEHPVEKYRLWMVERARQRAISDAEEPLWLQENVLRFTKAFFDGGDYS